jgi:hypothetical protein
MNSNFCLFNLQQVYVAMAGQNPFLLSKVETVAAQQGGWQLAEQRRERLDAGLLRSCHSFVLGLSKQSLNPFHVLNKELGS